MTAVQLTKLEAQIVVDVLTLVMADPDWRELATATGAEWAALGRAEAKIRAATQ